ncbi:MAG: DUF1566 domain-containing protein [Blastocatellia bacterium]
MKWQSKLVYVLLFGTIVIASVKPFSLQKNDNQGYWIDPATGLMWAGKDNNRDVRWYKAKRYCRNLRLGGYSDWRLAAIEELEGIYDETSNAPGLGAGKDGKQPWQWHVKGNLFLTGEPWSGTQIMDERGKPNGFVWYFDFWNKYKGKDDATFLGEFHRALCVRSSK